MNSSKDISFVNSGTYTPIYLIQNPEAVQTNYIITVGNVEQKPVNNNLKSFYENSGNIDDTVVGNNGNSRTPRILKKSENAVSGNSLKLASFLLPKNNNVTTRPYILNNFVFKPDANTAQKELINNHPKIEVDKKVVKFKDVTAAPLNNIETLLVNAKLNNINAVSTPVKVTQVKLLKLGGTYHSLINLDESQTKMVNKALAIFTNQEKSAPDPTYDPITNTKYVFNVVSPEDLTVVGHKNIITKEKREEKKLDLKRESVKKHIYTDDEFEDEPEPPAVTKVTRSGRTVRLPKLIIPDEHTHRRRKKTHVVYCFQCSSEFNSIYRLQKHYENHPTHIPAKIHSNLFHCLLAIIKGGSESERTNIFIQQLEQLIVKLKSLWPCLVKNIDGSEGKPCTINEDVSKIFGIDPGKYVIDENALSCIKDKDGFCIHNPPETKVTKDLNQPMQIFILVPNKDQPTSKVPNNEDCARISSAEKWPTVNKRVWKLKRQLSMESNPKKRKLDDENSVIQLDMELDSESAKTEDSDVNMRLTYDCDDILKNLGIEKEKDTDVCNVEEKSTNNIEDSKIKNHLEFHSTHFDIRSSPIKPSSTVFHKFQINPEKLPKYDAQIISATDNEQRKDFRQTNSDTLDDILSNNISNVPKDNVIDQDWILGSSDKSEDDYTKSNNLIEPSLIHLQDLDKSLNINGSYQANQALSDPQLISSQDDSVLQFFDTLGNNTCLSYPNMDLRNNNDFNLDIFPFSNSQ